MFTTEQVKKFITHSDPLISNTAIRYFSESFLYENDDTLMPLVLERFKQSMNDYTIHLYLAFDFPQTEATFSEMVELIQVPHIDIQAKYHLLTILARSDYFRELEDPAIKQLIWKDKNLRRKSVQVINRIGEMDDRKLERAFHNHIKDCNGKYESEIETFYGDELVRELSRRRTIDTQTILQKLMSNELDFNGYEAIYYTQLAGEMKLEAAIPLLCRFIGEDGDLLPSKAVKALVKIGTPTVITTLTEHYEQATEEYYRLFATDVFGKIKRPESEQALIKLMPVEEDLTYATKLAEGLCELGSSQGVPLIEKMIEEGYDEGYLNLKKSYYAYCIISNTDHPMLNEWQDEFEAEKQRLAQREAELIEMGKKHSSSIAKSHEKTKKVGRNEPCPCGSSKKYKRCCGA